MTKKEYFLLYLISTVFLSLLTFAIREPGYMDAEYYYAGGIQIFSGTGGHEPYLWNYLNSPESLPSASFLYWMPLTSLVTAAGMGLTGTTGFYGARLFFVLIAGLIPLLSAWFANAYTQSRVNGWLAGCCAIFSVYYLPYLTLTDSFSLFMVFGGVFTLLAFKIHQRAQTIKKLTLLVFLLGITAGFIHLTRADGILWLVFGLIVIVVGGRASGNIRQNIPRFFLSTLLFIAGYLLVMSGWYARNLSLFHSLIPPGNGKILWATNYDDIFYYWSDSLNPSSFAAFGFGNILLDRISAFWSNIKNILAVNGSLVLVPLMAFGIWVTRKHFITRLTLGISLTILLLMTFIFPYAGYRGGFFHSNSSIQTILWGLVPVGFTSLIDLGVKHRKWIPARARKMFGAALIGALSILSTVIFLQKLEYKPGQENYWNRTSENYRSIDKIIEEATSDTDSIIMVNDPPGYYLATQRRSIVNPSDGMEGFFAAAEKYNARYAVVNENNVRLLKDFYTNGTLNKRLRILGTRDGNQIYEITK